MRPYAPGHHEPSRCHLSVPTSQASAKEAPLPCRRGRARKSVSARPHNLGTGQGQPLEAVTPLLELVASREPLTILLNALALFVERLSPEMRCSVLLADNAARTLRHGAGPNLPRAYNAAIDNVAYGEGVGSCGTAAARRTMVIVPDIQASPLWTEFRELAATHGLAACWSTPLIDSKGELLGTFAMYYTRTREPTTDELNVLRIAGPLAAMVIQRHRDAERLRESETRYRQLAETCPDAIVALVDGRIAYANTAAVRLFGLPTVTGLVGRQLGDFCAPEQQAQLLRHRAGTYATRLRRADGTGVPVEIAATELAIDAVPTVVLVCRDVSERRTLENEIIDAASREQESLGYDLHDGIGQQLTGISLLIQSLVRQTRATTPAVAQELERIGALVASTIEETRALATGMSPVAVERAGLGGALASLGANVQALHALRVSVRLGPDAGAGLSAARATHLYRIAQEALRNAARHGQAQHAEISLVQRGDHVHLTVVDDGVGLADVVPEAGGLGLRSMRYRAERLGGSIEIATADPRGTRIRVSCPVDDVTR